MLRKARTRPRRNERRWLLLACGCLLAPPGGLLACRYTVRDTGFVNLQPDYELTVLLERQTPAETATALGYASGATLAHANVTLRLLSPDTDSRGEFAGLIRQHQVLTFPTAVLTSPEGPAYVEAAPSNGDAPGSSRVERLVEAVLGSPQRQALLKACLDHFAVVLLAEGSEPEPNRRAVAAAQAAVRRFAALQEHLPKPVKSAPVVQRVAWDRRRQATPGMPVGQEGVLLWALGVADRGGAEPEVAVVYGRGRRCGKPLRGPLITADEILRILSVIGQDCECDLDRAWMQGPLIPARWGPELQSAAVKQLGFDPDSPLVKAEISRILARGTGGGARRVNPASRGNDNLLGYQETPVAEAPEAEPAGDAAAANVNARPGTPLPPPGSALPPQTASVLPTLVSVGLLAVGVGTAVVFIWFKRKAS